MTSMMENINRVSRQRNFSHLVVMVLSAALIISLLCNYSKSKPVVIELPPSIKTGFWVEGKKVSTSYLQEMGLWLAHLMFDKSALSQRFNHQTFLLYVDGSYQTHMVAKMNEDEDMYIREGLSTIFYPSDSVVDGANNEVLLTGNLASTVGTKVVSKRELKLIIGFTYVYGKWKVTKFEEQKDEK